MINNSLRMYIELTLLFVKMHYLSPLYVGCVENLGKTVYTSSFFFKTGNIHVYYSFKF